MQLVIMPTYNEYDNIGELLSQVYTALPDVHVLIVDDNSPDGTAAYAEYLAQWQYKHQLFILKRTGKLGLGTAYVAGFLWALARPYRHIFQMDADFSHDPKYLKAFAAGMDKYDLVLGSRYVDGGGTRNWGLFRRIISRGGSFYSRLILGLPFRDLTGGFKCFRREVLEQIDLTSIMSNGYAFQIETTYRTFLRGFHVGEIPIVFEERNHGRSKMSSTIFSEALFMVPKLRLTKKLLSSGQEISLVPSLPRSTTATGQTEAKVQH